MKLIYKNNLRRTFKINNCTGRINNITPTCVILSDNKICKYRLFLESKDLVVANLKDSVTHKYKRVNYYRHISIYLYKQINVFGRRFLIRLKKIHEFDFDKDIRYYRNVVKKLGYKDYDVVINHPIFVITANLIESSKVYLMSKYNN